jgi:FkbM family methyltransferase
MNLNYFDISETEQKQMESFKENNTIFDVGCSIGCWSECALTYCNKLDIHLFDPLGTLKNRGIGKFNPIALSNFKIQQPFWMYKEHMALSSFYRISERFENDVLKIKPVQIAIDCDTIDNYCVDNSVKKIDYLKIDVEGSEFDVLKGAIASLQNKIIRKIQIEYGATFINAGIKLKDIFDLLIPIGYHATILSDESESVEKYTDDIEIFNFCNYLFEL